MRGLVTDAGTALLTQNCQSPFPFQTNQPVMGDRLSCPNLFLLPFSQCPLHYTMGQLQGGQLVLAGPPSCTSSSRPNTFAMSLPMTSVTGYFFSLMGLWCALAHCAAGLCELG
jgi:hypothetical protein